MTEMQQYQPLFTILKDIIRRAVLTLAVLPDREEGWLSYRSAWPEFARDINEAYGYSAPRARRFRPTAKDIAQLDVVMPWLSFIKREESSFAVRRICAWAFGAPLWRIGQWDNCSADTVMRRIDRSVALIVRQFAGVEVATAPDIAEETQSYAVIFEKPTGGSMVKIMKVYVGGDGFYRNGKKIRRAIDFVENQKISA